MGQYQIPGAPLRLHDGAAAPAVQLTTVLPVSQPEMTAYRALHRHRHLVGTVPFLQTLTPTITSNLDWLQTTVDVVWT